MAKNAQISLFLIVGLILVVAAVGGGLYYFSSNRAAADSREFLTTQADFESSTTGLRNMVQSCLEKNTEEAMKRYSIREDSAPKIGEYLEITLPSCVDFAYFEERGFSLTRDEPWANVIITEDAIVVELTYNIRMKRGSETINLKEFSYNIPRLKSGQLSLDPVTGETIEPVFVIPEDESAELEVPEGIIATASDGSPITEVSLKLLDKNFEGLSNSVLAGKIVYEGLPDGARFSSPVTLRIKYDDNDIPPGMTVDDLSIAYFDRARGIWMSLPTTIDKENSQLIAQTTHFTVFGSVAKCSENEAEIITINNAGGNIYVQSCGIGGGTGCGDGDWEYDNIMVGLHEKQKGVDGYDMPKYSPGGGSPYGQESDYGCTFWDWDKDDTSFNAPIIEDDATNSCGATTYNGDVNADCNNLWDKKVEEFYKGLDTDHFTEYDQIKNGALKNCILYLEGTECKLKLPDSPESQIATPKTCGYAGPRNKDGYVAGTGVLYFTIEGNGNACVAEETILQDQNTIGTGNIWAQLLVTTTSPDIQDSLICAGEGAKNENEEYITASCSNFESIEGVNDVVTSFMFNSGSLKTGLNKLEIGFKDPKEGDGPNGCFSAIATLTLQGRGLTPITLEACDPATATTVGQRYKYLCGCDITKCEYQNTDEFYPISRLYNGGYANSSLCDPAVISGLSGYYYPQTGGRCDEEGNKLCTVGIELGQTDDGCKCGESVTESVTYSYSDGIKICDGSSLTQVLCNTYIYPGIDDGCYCDENPFIPEGNFDRYICNGGIYPLCPEGRLISSDSSCYCEGNSGTNQYNGESDYVCSGEHGLLPICVPENNGKLAQGGEACLCGGKDYWDGTSDAMCIGGELSGYNCPIDQVLTGKEGCKCNYNQDGSERSQDYTGEHKQKCTKNGLVDVECPQTGAYLTSEDLGCKCNEEYYDAEIPASKCDGNSIVNANCVINTKLSENSDGYCVCVSTNKGSETYSSGDYYCSSVNGLVEITDPNCPESQALTEANNGCLCGGVPYNNGDYWSGPTCIHTSGFKEGHKKCPTSRQLYSSDGGCYCKESDDPFTPDGKTYLCSEDGITEILEEPIPCRVNSALWPSDIDCKCGDGNILTGTLLNNSAEYYDDDIPPEQRGVYCIDGVFMDWTQTHQFT